MSVVQEVTGRCSGLLHSTNMNNITTTSIITEDQGGGGLGECVWCGCGHLVVCVCVVSHLECLWFPLSQVLRAEGSSCCKAN